MARAFTGKPPKIPTGAIVRLDSVPVAGIIEGSLDQRPYWVMLDADHQEVGDRHCLQLAFDAYTDGLCRSVVRVGAGARGGADAGLSGQRGVG